MEKNTFTDMPAKAQRIVLFDMITELKKGLKISAFFGGFTGMFTLYGGIFLAKAMFWK